MFDNDALQSIANARKKANTNDLSKYNESECLYHLGMTLMAMLKQIGFQDKTLAHKVSHILIKSAQKNRKDPRPFVALGYLVLIFEDTTKATQYLLQALEIDPQNSDAKYLLKAAKDRALKGKSEGTGELSPEPLLQTQHSVADTRTDIDYDELYDKVEFQINEQVQESMRQTHLLAPTLEPMNLMKLQQFYQELKQNYDYIDSQMDILDDEFDMDELEDAFKPLETMLKQAKNSLEQSQNMINIRESIAKKLDAAEMQFEEAQSEDPEAEAMLDEIFDHYEVLANEFEGFETKGCNIVLINEHYEKLNLALENLQTLLSK